MKNSPRRIPLFRFGYIDYKRSQSAMSGSFELQAVTALVDARPPESEQAFAVPQWGESDNHEQAIGSP